MAKVKQWRPDVPLIIFDNMTRSYPGVKDIHCHKGRWGNIHVKMVFEGDRSGNKTVSGDVDGQTSISKLEDLLDWMYRKGQQNGWT